MMDLIRNYEVATIFEGLKLTRVDSIICMTIKELEDLSFTPLGESKPLTLEENKIYQIKALKGFILSTRKSTSLSKFDYALISISDFRSFKYSSEWKRKWKLLQLSLASFKSSSKETSSTESKESSPAKTK